jgi:TatA/E family protein of Tat protein translocase
MGGFTMFNLSLPELIVIGAAGLLVLGPKRLPDLAKNLGVGIREFKKALEESTKEEAPKLTQAQEQPTVHPPEEVAKTGSDPTHKS